MRTLGQNAKYLPGGIFLTFRYKYFGVDKTLFWYVGTHSVTTSFNFTIFFLSLNLPYKIFLVHNPHIDVLSFETKKNTENLVVKQTLSEFT